MGWLSRVEGLQGVGGGWDVTSVAQLRDTGGRVLDGRKCTLSTVKTFSRPSSRPSSPGSSSLVGLTATIFLKSSNCCRA
jgi:hypothetical protein